MTLVEAGKKYGLLTAVRRVRSTPKYAVWLCQCDCGGLKEIRSDYLSSGHTRSCGCQSGKRAGKETDRRVVWNGIKQRCLNPNNRIYKHYGGRGICVCDRWLKGDGVRSGFECFESDMGPRPPGYSIERIDNDGDYEPGNCKWATQLEQANNQRPKKTAKLTDADVIAIRKSAETNAALGRLYGVSDGHVSDIRHGKKHKPLSPKED